MIENKEGALIRLGQAAAKIQNYVGITDSTSEQLLVFKICLETVNNLRSISQTDSQSLIYSITGELEDKLSKKHKNSGKWLMDGCREVAELFVNQVWLGVLKGRAPSQRHRRVLASIYRMASLQAHKERVEAKKVKDNSEEVTE